MSERPKTAFVLSGGAALGAIQVGMLRRAGVTETDFGTREFATLDGDGNLLTFFRWNDRP